MDISDKSWINSSVKEKKIKKNIHPLLRRIQFLPGVFIEFHYIASSITLFYYDKMRNVITGIHCIAISHLEFDIYWNIIKVKI